MSASLETLNERQREAVLHTEGPLLILAGAGAGKTRVLTYRIAYLIEEKGVAPYQIMAITFTNKAAAEMKERVQNLVEFGDSVWVMTFHSTCVRILRRFIDRLGYDTDFTIYDTDDQKTVVRHVIKELDLDPKSYKERAMLTYISTCKNELRTAEDELKAASDFRKEKEARIYEAYEKRLRQNNALDFDDLLLKTVELFRKEPEVLNFYQDRFRYIMIDEYQDTNPVQFEFVWLLANKYKNLCVVGDDDQSIYRFRGADIRNILEFEKHFPGTKVVKLEQNYRSTTRILDAANAVISNNRDRKVKHLWSQLGVGDEISFHQYENGYEEAEEVVREICRLVRTSDWNYRDFAVLYRTNAQSRLFEEKCIIANVPYRVVGGVNFYQRAEIKDLLAYLKTIAGGRDDLAVRRIINVPKRGIGDATVDKLAFYASSNDISLLEAIRHADRVPGIGAAEKKLAVFSHLIGELREAGGMLSDGNPISEEERANALPFDDLIREIIDKTDYYSVFDDLDEEQAEQKKENIEELISKAHDFEENYEGEHAPTLIDFLEEIALVADVDSISEDDNRVLLMTLHSSKGLEFPAVFLCGMEDGLFPSMMALMTGNPADIEEERRLCYVGITRAQKKLFLSAAKARTVNGEFCCYALSRFLREIPEDILGIQRKVEKKYVPPAPAERKPSPAPAATFGRTFEVKSSGTLSYDVGDRVRHSKFGEGTVREIEKGKQDFEVCVLFDNALFGEKRMFASFAKLEKI